VRDVCVKITDFGMGTDKSRTNTYCTKQKGPLEVKPANMPPWDFQWDQYETGQLEVFGCGFILLQLCYVDSLEAQSLLGPRASRLWIDELYSGKTFEQQCTASRHSESKVAANTAFWELVQGSQSGPDLPQVKMLLNKMLDADAGKRVRMEAPRGCGHATGVHESYSPLLVCIEGCKSHY